MVNIGIIGTGFGAKVQLPAFERTDGVKLIGIARREPEKSDAIAMKHRHLRAFSSWQELVQSPDIEAVSISTPPYLHKEMALFAFKHKKHVLCEKPLAVIEAEAEEMLTAAQQSGCRHMVDFEFKEIPEWIQMRECKDQGMIGKIRKIDVRWITGGRARFDVPFGWQNDLKLGGGVLLNFGSHVIDYLEWFFGPIREVKGTLETRKKLVGGKKADADDWCAFECMLESRAKASIEISNVVEGGFEHTIEVIGQTGSLTLANPNIRESVYGFSLLINGVLLPLPPHIKRLEPSLPDGRIATFMRIAEKFVRSIETGTDIEPTFETGLRVQRIVDAIRESDRLGKNIVVQ